LATAAEAATMARLLDAFDREYPPPGTTVLSRRLEQLPDRQRRDRPAVGDPAVAVALLALPPNV